MNSISEQPDYHGDNHLRELSIEELRDLAKQGKLVYPKQRRFPPQPIKMPDVEVGDAHTYFSKWSSPRVERLHGLSIRAGETYQKLYDRDDQQQFAANAWLREIYDQVKPFWRGHMTDVNIENLSKELAERFATGVKYAQAGFWTWESVQDKAVQFLEYINLPFPRGKTLATALARLQDAKWWRRKLNEAIPRIVDQVSRELGLVHRDDEIYISNAALDSYRSRQRAARELLDNMEAVNDIGQSFTLSELADKSISNPANRRTEMLVRVRGMEEHAESKDFAGLFLTITAPSKYHCYSKGKANDNFNASTPRGANDYLNGAWSRCRAQFARDGAEYFGVRVAEPHHDGTPHWHVLLFAYQEQLQKIESTVWRYALAEDAKEIGAKTHRVKAEYISAAKGSATGYIAKYISKSIDGAHLDTDLYGKPAKDSAERVTAWSRTWGIRQFQFFGSVSVGPWRELRRRRSPCDVPYEIIRLAADQSDFKTYIEEAQFLGLQIFREPWFDRKTGECAEPNLYNQYGELRDDPVRGVEITTDYAPKLYTRLCEWSVQPLTVAVNDWTLSVEPAFALASDEIAQPWTCVNNCTDPLENDYEDCLHSPIDNPQTYSNGPPI